MTTAQIARLFYDQRKDGQPAKSFILRPRKNSPVAYETVPGYFSAWQILDRMRKDNQIACLDVSDKSMPDLWTLKTTRGLSKWNREHETDCADIFVEYYKTKKLASWDARWTRDEFHDFGEKYHVYYDRRMELDGQDVVFFWEIDKGTEDFPTLKKKVSDYVRLSDAFPTDPFFVLFSLQGGRWKDLGRRRDQLIDLFPERGRQFLAASHEDVLSDPLGKIFHTREQAYSVLDLL